MVKMTQPKRLTPDELKTINKKYAGCQSLERDDYWKNIYDLLHSVPALTAHIEAIEADHKREVEGLREGIKLAASVLFNEPKNSAGYNAREGLLYTLESYDKSLGEYICGFCGKPGADKLPHPVRWPGEDAPGTDYVHKECEDVETKRAHSLLTDEQRKEFLKWC